MALAPFIVFPPVTRDVDVVLLTLFRSAAKKNENPFALFAKVDAITGTEIDPALVNAAAHTLDVGKIPQSDAIESRSNLSRRFGIEPIEPLTERTATAGVLIFKYIDRRPDGNIYYTILAGHIALR
jgi:hypothetical protein